MEINKAVNRSPERDIFTLFRLFAPKTGFRVRPWWTWPSSLVPSPAAVLETHGGRAGVREGEDVRVQNLEMGWQQ